MVEYEQEHVKETESGCGRENALSANGLPMPSPGRPIGNAPINWAPTSDGGQAQGPHPATHKIAVLDKAVFSVYNLINRSVN